MIQGVLPVNQGKHETIIEAVKTLRRNRFQLLHNATNVNGKLNDMLGEACYYKTIWQNYDNR